ncbi:A disintegrin and metalloproteinase with thrombospondin motifs 3-like [Lineus longissimus]|uniref:A disintegrin and metalloproteinase with thrombospondin motifs 3-like n=1 Tax=Lineus longissimus TaxID=88925 RepID=UPI002B4D2F55
MRIPLAVWIVLHLKIFHVALSEEDDKLKSAKNRNFKGSLSPITTVPFLASNDGSLLSYDISGRTRDHRSRRSTDQDNPADTIYVVVPMEKETVILDLTRKSHLLAPVAIAESWENGTLTGRRLRGDCFYQGRIRGMKSSMVAVSSCHGLHGLIETDTTGYFIEPLKRDDVDGKQRHVIYPESRDRGDTVRDVSENVTEGDLVAYHQMMTRLQMAGHHRVRQKRHNGPHRFNLEVILVVDANLREFHGEDRVEEYLITLMNIVDEVYHHPTLGVVINIVLSKILYLSQKDNTLFKADHFIVPGNAKATLDLFCVWANSVLTRHRTPEQPQYHVHDFAIFLTKENIGPAGYAPVTGMCNPLRSCSVNRDEGLTSAFVIAHEIGHVFGMMHDGQGNNCGGGDPTDGRIMAPLVQSTFDTHYWSHCAASILGDMIEHYPCLQDDPFDPGYPEYEKPYGENWYPDQQCRQEFGEGFTKCKAFPMPMCDQLWCSTPGNDMMCKTKKSPPLDGTPCGPYSWCMNGICEQKTDIPSIDGGWSQWAPWTECSRTCGNGVQFRTRLCNNPSPINNGKECTGHRGEFQLCNQVVCPEGTDLRAAQCSAFDPDVYRGGRLHTWLPYVSKHKALRCELMCISAGPGDIFATGQPLIDGTPCDYENKHNVCVRGECEKVGCDGVLGSDKVDDQCGVCNGDNSECTQISGIYDKKPTRSYTHVLLLPRGARHIKIEENGASSHFLALKVRSKREFLLNGNRREGESTEVIYEGVRFFYHNDQHRERLASSGPLTTEVMIMLYPVGSLSRADISFEYILPLEVGFGASASFSGKEEFGFERYVWDTRGWTDCSKTCGTGAQYEIYVCIDQYLDELATLSDCLEDTKPKAESRECNTQDCFSLKWQPKQWTPCSATCGNNGVSDRKIYCMKHIEGLRSKEVRVRANNCDHLPKPKWRVPCNRHPCPLDWSTENWSLCTKTCDEGVQTRRVYCNYPQDGNNYKCTGIKPISSRPCTIKQCPNCDIPSTCRNRGPLCRKNVLNRAKCKLALFRIMCCKSCTLVKNGC